MASSSSVVRLRGKGRARVTVARNRVSVGEPPAEESTMLVKPVIDIDPELLRRGAYAGRHAFTESWDHISKESTGHIPTILGTLIPEGPWAWAIMTHSSPDGSINLPVVTS